MKLIKGGRILLLGAASSMPRWKLGKQVVLVENFGGNNLVEIGVAVTKYKRVQTVGRPDKLT